MNCPAAAKNGMAEIWVPLARVTGNAYFRSNHKRSIYEYSGAI